MFQSCEKEALTGTESSAATEDEAFTVIPQLEDRPLSDLHVSFVDGIPVYENTQHFLMVDRVISRSSEADYLAWAEREGLNSIYHDYLKLAERVEANPEVPSQEQISKAESQFIFHMDEGGVAINPYLTAPKLTDEEGRLYISDDLHLFTPENHILIDGGTPDKLAQVVLAPISDASNGVIVQMTEERGNPYTINQPGDKVQVVNITCPEIFASSTDSRGSVGNWWINHGDVQAFFEREDEQRVGCSRSRCRRGTRTFLMATTFLTEINDTQYGAATILRYAFNNRRRNRFNWTRTFPEVIIDDGTPVNSNNQMTIRLQSQAQTANGSIVTRSNTLFAISYPGQVAGGNGTAQEDIVLLSQGVTVNHPISDVGFLGTMSIVSGNVRHRWTTGSNDPVNDPISVEYRCQ